MKRKLSAKHLAALQRGRKRYQASKRKPKIPRRRYAPKGKHFERKTTIRGKTAYITSRLKRNPRPWSSLKDRLGVSAVLAKARFDARKKPAGISQREWVEKRYPKMSKSGQTWLTRMTAAKRNPRPRFVIRGNRGVSSRDFWYYNGEGKFIKNRRAAKSYPSSIAAIGVARSIQNRLPFSIYSIEVVKVGK